MVKAPIGKSNRITPEQEKSETSSLNLIHVQKIQLKVFRSRERFNDMKEKLRTYFWFSDVHYDLSVTDPKIEKQYLARNNGDYDVDECHLTISLGEPYVHDKKCYKLVAAAITI